MFPDDVGFRQIAPGITGFNGDGDVAGFAPAPVEAPVASVQEAVVIEINRRPTASVLKGGREFGVREFPVVIGVGYFEGFGKSGQWFGLAGVSAGCPASGVDGIAVNNRGGFDLPGKAADGPEFLSVL